MWSYWLLPLPPCLSSGSIPSHFLLILWPTTISLLLMYSFFLQSSEYIQVEKHPFSLTPWEIPPAKILPWCAFRVESNFPNNNFSPNINSDAWCGTNNVSSNSQISVQDGECQIIAISFHIFSLKVWCNFWYLNGAYTRKNYGKWKTHFLRFFCTQNFKRLTCILAWFFFLLIW